MNSFFIIAFFAMLNRIRGDGRFCRPLFSKYVAMSMCGLLIYIITHDYKLSLCVGVGLIIWCAKGWGKYFNLWAGDDNNAERQEPITDYITDKVFGNVYKGVSWSKNKNTFAMSIRGFIYSIPMFCGLYYITHDMICLYLMPSFLLQGIVYRCMPDNFLNVNFIKYSVGSEEQAKYDIIMWAELAFGAYIGIIISIVLNLL